MKLRFWENIEFRFRHSAPSEPESDEVWSARPAERDQLQSWLSELGQDLANLDHANLARPDQDEPPSPR